jgi:phage/plasmid-associated DNA primase
MKSGANPEVANMSRKRMVVWREPPEDRAIQFSVVKELTGGSKINARALYSNDVETHIDVCFLMECNAKPRLEGDTGYSMSERVVDVPFVSTYLPKDKISADMENVYEANPLYKDSEWQEEYKHSLIHVLLDFMRENELCYSNLQKLKMGKVVTGRSKDYVMGSDNLFPIFQEHYQEQEGSYISVDEFKHEFISSGMFQNLKKSEKREWSKKKYFLEKVKSNTFLKPYYKAIHQYRRDGKKVCCRNVLVGWTHQAGGDSGDDSDDDTVLE